MATNYDKIATIYDPLSRLIYGRQIVNAQIFLLQFITPGNHILIVGGGTGWILEEITRRYPSGLVIDYVESSAQMIRLSKNRNYGANRVNFINKAIENFKPTEGYHVIFTPFIFDNFKPDKTSLVFNALDKLLLPAGIWLYADFAYDEINGKWWQKLLLKTMYLFFTLTCNIETSEIENMSPYFARYNYSILGEKCFYKGFIKAGAYRKP